MADKGWKVYNLAQYTPPLWVQLILHFKRLENHFDPEANRGVAFKTLFHTIYVYMTYAISYDGGDGESDDRSPEYDGTQIDNDDEPWRN